MDFRFDSKDVEFRDEVAEFADKELPWDWRTETLDPEEPEDGKVVQQFKRKLADQGWLTMAWPSEYGGRDAPHIQQMIFNEEMAYRGVPVGDMGVRMVGPILMMYGTDEQKANFLPKIAKADISWCQGYSEPNSGSDLASLQTRAVVDGDDYVVNGSKLWNGAHSGADHMFLLTRTDPDAPKHRGISFLLTEMAAPGITVERVPMMWDGARALVTFDDVRIARENLVGEENRGWYVGAALLDFERSGVDRPARAKRILEDLVKLCKETRRNGKTLSEDPVFRHRLADAAVQIEAARMMCYQVAWMQSQGQVPNREASTCKAFGTEMILRMYNLGMQIMGLHGQLKPGSKHAPLEGRLEKAYLAAHGGQVAGGTSEIQRNVIATRGLGLPRG
jgi:alkylation response protein AidB-like acyl-CoA dehydrogenase